MPNKEVRKEIGNEGKWLIRTQHYWQLWISKSVPPPTIIRERWYTYLSEYLPTLDDGLDQMCPGLAGDIDRRDFICFQIRWANQPWWCKRASIKFVRSDTYYDGRKKKAPCINQGFLLSQSYLLLLLHLPEKVASSPSKWPAQKTRKMHMDRERWTWINASTSLPLIPPSPPRAQLVIEGRLQTQARWSLKQIQSLPSTSTSCIFVKQVTFTDKVSTPGARRPAVLMIRRTNN